MNLSRNQISFLRDIPSNIKIDMTSGWRYHYFDGSLSEISEFIQKIGDDKIYIRTVILFWIWFKTRYYTFIFFQIQKSLIESNIVHSFAVFFKILMFYSLLIF